MPEQIPLEERFKAFKEELAAKDFNSADFLEAQATLIRPTDTKLANRIMHRVKNLRNQQAAKKAKQNQAPAQAASPTDSKTLVEPDSKQQAEAKKPELTWQQKAKKRLTTPFVLFVIFPTMIFAFYQVFWATERYESQAKMIVQQPDSTSTLDSSLALLSGLGVSSTGGSDPQLLNAYIQSNDMLVYLNSTLNLKAHYSNPEADVFSRLKDDAVQEDFLKFYQNHIIVELDEASGVISINVQGFDPEYAQQLTQQIVSRSEWYINNIGHQLAEAQLAFVKGEYQMDEDRLRNAQATLLNFQHKYSLLDPTAEGAAMQQIAYGIEGQIAAKEAELKGLTNIMSEQAPRVQASKNELEALRKQLENERSKLAEEGGRDIPVSEILAKYTDLKIGMEIALQSYTSSKVSLEKSRIEAYRQLKYLITVQTATTPEKSTYPDAFYNVSLFLILLAMAFAIIRIIYAIVHELR